MLIVQATSQIFEFVQHILFLKMCLGGDLPPFGHTAGSLLIPPGRQSWPEIGSEHCCNGFDKLKKLTNSDITILNLSFLKGQV